jgi:hypothetical protein
MAASGLMCLALCLAGASQVAVGHTWNIYSKSSEHVAVRTRQEGAWVGWVFVAVGGVRTLHQGARGHVAGN